MAEVIQEVLKRCLLLESSLQRIWQHYQDSGFAMISAYRSDKYDLATNQKRSKKLESDIRSKNYGFVKTFGSWTYENGERGTEESFFIPQPSHVSWEKFSSDILSLGHKYEQEGILLHNVEERTTYDISPESGHVRGKYHSMKVDDRLLSQAWTEIKKGSHAGRRFVFESCLDEGGLT